MKSQPKYTWFRSIASLLILLGYLVSSVSFETLHQAVHHHDYSELHSQTAEADACHRAIYHGDVSQDCEHKSHLTEFETDCKLCDVTVSRVYVYPISQAVSTTDNSLIEHLPSALIWVSKEALENYVPRGPPTVS